MKDGLSPEQIELLKQREKEYQEEFKIVTFSTRQVAELLEVKFRSFVSYLLSHNILKETADGRFVPHQALKKINYCFVNDDGEIEWYGRGLEFLITYILIDAKQIRVS